MAAFAGLGPIDPINGILAGGAVQTAGEGPLPSLAGFDAILQFSGRTLQAQISSSLGQLTLSASVPWGSIPVPASFLALIPPVVLRTLSARLAYIELTLTAPYVAALRWPTSLIVGTGGVGLAASAVAPHVVTPPPLEQRFVDIGWQLEINIVSPTTKTAPSFIARSPGQGTGAGGATAGAGAGSAAAGGASSGGSALATGTVITTARAAAAVRSGFWVFSEQLDFSATTPTATSTTQGVADFMATAGGQTLLNQAVVGLKTLGGVSLSPDVAPAGPPSVVAQAAGLPALQVTDILLQDAAGNSVLCLCVEIAGTSGGVLQQVQPLLQTLDFAYVASAKLLGYALKARWAVVADGVSIVGETQVELGTEGETGLAKVMVLFGALTDVEIVAVADGSGDVLRLLGSQIVRLLELWDQNGNQVTNLGALANAQVQPFVLAVNYFVSSGAQSLQANFETLLLQLMVVVGFPILDAFSIDASSVTGFTSSPLQANLVRWALTTAGPPTTLGQNAP